MERDDGNLFVLEGVLVALILLGAAYAVRSMQDSSLTLERPRSQLEGLTHDVLTVLGGLTDGNGTSLLDLYTSQAYHCASDAVRSTTDCDSARPKNLSLKLDNYLPTGSGYAVEVGNGVDARELYRSPLPMREAVASSMELAPDWNTTFMASEFSCYDTTNDINVTLVPIDHGNLSYARYANVTLNGVEVGGAAASTSKWWNVTILAGHAATGTIVTNMTANGTMNASTSYSSCNLGASFASLRTALRAMSLLASAPRPAVGASETFSADISGITAVNGVTVTAVNVSIFEPLPARADTADSWIEEGRVALTGGNSRAGTWQVPPWSLYGTHPALLRIGLSVGGTSVELRKVSTIDIALPTGQVPIDPTYRIGLQTWLADWG